MGIFNTNEEISLYRELIKYIRYSKISRDAKDFLIYYINQVKAGKVINDFIDAEILEGAIIELLRHDFVEAEDVKRELNYYINRVRIVLPQGEKTPEFETIKKELLTHYFRMMGNKVFSQELYCIFDNRNDYLQIMEMIMDDQNLINNIDKIVDFSVQLAKEVDDQGLIKREIISYLHLFGSILSEDESYLQKRVNEARMRYGVYPGINEKTIASISREVEKARGILQKLEVLEKKVDSYVERVDAKTKLGIDSLTETIVTGKKEIESCATKAITKMQEDLAAAKKELLDELNKYLVSLEETMKSSSDQVFSQLLEDARSKLEQIRVVANSLSGATTKELLRIQNETQKSVDKLRNYVENSPELKESLQVVKESEHVVQVLAQYSAAQTEMNGAQAGIIIPTREVVQKEVIAGDEERFLVPNFVMTEGILDAFNRSIPFDQRMKKIEERISEMEKNGLIISPALREALPWYLMGKKIVYFYGPTQSGKTTVAELLAKVVESELLDGGKITEEHSITSYNDVRGVFDENALFYALYYGKTIFYDELDNGNPDNLIVLGTFSSKLVDKIDHPEKDVRAQFAKRRFVPVNANARIISAGNTTGKGRNREYTARSRMDESSLERMVPIYVGYSSEVEQKIFGTYSEWFKFFNFFREQCNGWANVSRMDSSEGNVTTGDASTIVECIKENSMPVSMLINGIFVQTKETDYFAYIVKNIKENKRDFGIETVSADKVKKYNNTPLAKLNAKQIAEVFVHEADAAIEQNKVLVKSG